MNSFDVMSGAIDGFLALLIYAGIIFGIRKLVHRIRHTTPATSNDKWMWMSVLAICAVVFVGGGMSDTSSAEASTPGRCEQVSAAMEKLSAQPKESPAQENWVRLQASNLVVNDPQCFDPGLVASAQAYIIKSR